MSPLPLVLIPARFESQRLPGKALADLGGMPMVVRCATNAASTGLRVCVCSDSPMILEACRGWSVDHLATPAFGTGTDRCTWAAQQLQAEWLVILQGDEPLISPQALADFAQALAHLPTDSILNGLSPLAVDAAQDPNNVKAVQRRRDGRITHLTRLPVLSERQDQPGPGHLKQLGLYGAWIGSLERFAALGANPLEQAEGIEMLRWLSAGLELQGVLLQTPAISVDTQTDLEAARRCWEQSPGARRPGSPSTAPTGPPGGAAAPCWDRR